MSAELLRLYSPPECGADGYPLAWRLGDPRIPDLVRDLTGHRCVRCRHPYRTKQTDPEWSPCDEECRHRGPYRVGSEELGWSEVEPHIADAEGAASAGLLVRELSVFVQAKWRVLTVHHLTGEKADCRWWNLAALCQRCHLYVQGRVRMDQVYPLQHTPWFRPYAAGFYAWRYLGEELSREEVAEREDELLALELAA